MPLSVQRDASVYPVFTESNRASALPDPYGCQSESVAIAVSKLGVVFVDCKTTLDDIVMDYKARRSALYNQRADTFEYIDKGTDHVRGAIKSGKTEADRDCYIRALVDFSALKAGLEGVAKESGFSSIESDLYIHHGNYLVGDLRALEDGREVPDFKYNSGQCQFG